jgi:hypothetical protein
MKSNSLAANIAQIRCRPNYTFVFGAMILGFVGSVVFRVWGISLVGFQERERESVFVFVRAPGRTSLAARTLFRCCFLCSREIFLSSSP